ncbi:ATP-binding protein [Desulfospira joergensenii]|uniref:ATP-binding protein n=1 Tax=Desulfospira joergensenii TaxID=53329 RepID=UPI0013770C23|nr:ATP-binding protein [Desulfospira joergensenii]
MSIRGRLLFSLFILASIILAVNLLFRDLIRESEYQISQFSKGALVEATYTSLMKDALNESHTASRELIHISLQYGYAGTPDKKNAALKEIGQAEERIHQSLIRFKKALDSAQKANQAQQDMAREFHELSAEESEIMESQLWLGRLDKGVQVYETQIRQLSDLSRTSHEKAATFLENDIEPFVSGELGRLIHEFRKDSREELEEQVKRLMENFSLKKNISFGALGVSLGLALLLSIYLSRTVSLPLSDLASAIKNMSEEEFVPPPTVRPDNEIGRLARVISDMDRTIKNRTRQLEQAKKELADQNRLLEKRVTEQTRNLIEQNASLTREILDRKQIEEQLRKSEEQFRLAMEASRDGIWDWNIETGHIYFSPGCTSMLGYGKDEFIPDARSWADRIHPEDRPRLVKINKDCIEKRTKGFTTEFRMKDKAGKWVWILERGKAIERDDKGTALRIIGTHTDITPLKQAEQEKIQAQKIFEEQKKLALVGQIAGKMAHDFNNTLGVIMGNAELALLDCPNKDLSKFFNRILDQTVRGKNLTKNLVAFAKDIEPKQEYFKLSRKIDLVLNLLKKELIDIEVIREDHPDTPNLLADPGMIEHTLINLIQNSVQALGKTETPRITIKTCCRDRDVLLEVIDNGCGIPPEFRDRIYEPAFTLKGSRDTSQAYPPGTKGTGYGLSNVKKYVDLHGGKILFDSSPESGTRFFIRLPGFQKQPSSIETGKAPEAVLKSGRNILLVEDESAIAEIQTRILSHPPYEHQVDVVDTGRAGIELFERNSNTYDLVSLDFILRGNLNGMDVYQHIRKKNKTLPILFISGNLEFLESIKALKQKDRFLDHLSKPCNNLDYIKSVNRLMRNASDRA